MGEEKTALPETISCFDGEYGFLSNFYPVKITRGDWEYQSSEAAYQSAKCPGHEEKFAASKPAKAKRMSRNKKFEVRADWTEIRLAVMEEILRLKFSNAELAEKLCATYPAILIEGNYWGDRFWGVDGHGENNLGKLLMKIRDELMENRTRSG